MIQRKLKLMKFKRPMISDINFIKLQMTCLPINLRNNRVYTNYNCKNDNGIAFDDGYFYYDCFPIRKGCYSTKIFDYIEIDPYRSIKSIMIQEKSRRSISWYKK